MAGHSMQWIEALAKRFADRRATLVHEIEILEAAIARLKTTHRPAIKRLVAEAAEAHSELSAAIGESAGLFERPKTRVLHGIKLGFRKEPGRVQFEDAAQVVKLIRKHLPDQADTLIKTVETPVKSALAQLSGAELKKIAVTIIDAGDVVLIKPADSDVDKLVDALLADDEEAAA